MNATLNHKSAQQTGSISLALRSGRPSNSALSSRLGRLGMLAALALGTLPGTQAALAQAAPVFPAAGVYLYGQVPEPDQIGMGYMVFESVDEQIVGALYMPNSSFDCFEGRVEGSELAMTVTNSYDQESYPYAVALETSDAIASASSAPAPLSLDGFHQLSGPSENDLRILATCKANLAQ